MVLLKLILRLFFELLLLELVLLLLDKLLLLGVWTIISKSTLELLLDWAYILIERLVSSCIYTVHHLTIRSWILTLVDLSLSSAYIDLVWLLLLKLLLINYALNKCGLIIQINSMFILQVINIVVQKLLIIT